jgi:hypothetical protein
MKIRTNRKPGGKKNYKVRNLQAGEYVGEVGAAKHEQNIVMTRITN